MDNSNLQFRTASELRKKREYEAAVVIYSELWKNREINFDHWSGWGYAYSLLKLNRFKESLAICRSLYPRFKEFEMLRSVYAANIYYTEFKFNSTLEIHLLKKAVDAIMKLTPPQSAYSFAPKAIFVVVKLLMNQMKIDWIEIEIQLLKLDPEWLDDAAFKYIDSRGKNAEKSSDLEQWYAAMIKTKAGLNKSEELLQLLADAKNKNIKWHYNNDIWLKRKEAFAYYQLGNREKAESLLREILRVKKDWFLIFDLTKVIDDQQEIRHLLFQAALQRGKPEMKLQLYEAIYHHLMTDETLRNRALLHLELIVALRKENEWEFEKSKAYTILIENGIDTRKIETSFNILQKLCHFWKRQSDYQEEKTKRKKGVISVIFPSGNAGFVQSDKESFYFQLKKGESKLLQKGQKITFELIDSFDKKKNKPSKMAIKLIFLS